MARKSRALPTFSGVAGVGVPKANSVATSVTARSKLSFGVSAVSSAPASAACVRRWPASMDADVSHQTTSDSGASLATRSRPDRGGAGGVTWSRKYPSVPRRCGTRVTAGAASASSITASKSFVGV